MHIFSVIIIFFAWVWQFVIQNWKRFFISAILNYEFHFTPGLFLFTFLNQRRHLFYFFISSWIFDSFYNYLFTFHFYKDGGVVFSAELLRETTCEKYKKQLCKRISWLCHAMYYRKKYFWYFLYFASFGVTELQSFKFYFDFKKTIIVLISNFELNFNYKLETVW